MPPEPALVCNMSAFMRDEEMHEEFRARLRPLIFPLFVIPQDNSKVFKIWHLVTPIIAFTLDTRLKCLLCIAYLRRRRQMTITIILHQDYLEEIATK